MWVIPLDAKKPIDGRTLPARYSCNPTGSTRTKRNNFKWSD